MHKAKRSSRIAAALADFRSVGRRGRDLAGPTVPGRSLSLAPNHLVSGPPAHIHYRGDPGRPGWPVGHPPGERWPWLVLSRVRPRFRPDHRMRGMAGPSVNRSDAAGAVLLLYGVLLVFTFVIFQPKPPTGFIPQQDMGRFPIVSIQTPDSASLQRTRDAVDLVELDYPRRTGRPAYRSRTPECRFSSRPTARISRRCSSCSSRSLTSGGDPRHRARHGDHGEVAG